MDKTTNNQINYWASIESYDYQSSKPKRSIKRKLGIVLCFIGVLAITPSLIYALSNFNFDNPKEVSVLNSQTQTQPQKTTPEVHTVTIEEPKEPKEPKKPANQAEIINNDSYWKISKRVCGTGKYYLSIQSQNGSKALHRGDTVTVSCVL